jgi:CDP-glucose 4,6-dehydratase
MLLAERIAADPSLAGQAFNFSNELQVTVMQLVQALTRVVGSALEPEIRNHASNEIQHQYLSASKARSILGWQPLFTLDEGLHKTAGWYREFLSPREQSR